MGGLLDRVYQHCKFVPTERQSRHHSGRKFKRQALDRLAQVWECLFCVLVNEGTASASRNISWSHTRRRRGTLIGKDHLWQGLVGQNSFKPKDGVQ